MPRAVGQAGLRRRPPLPAVPGAPGGGHGRRSRSGARRRAPGHDRRERARPRPWPRAERARRRALRRGRGPARRAQRGQPDRRARRRALPPGRLRSRRRMERRPAVGHGPRPVDPAARSAGASWGSPSRSPRSASAGTASAPPTTRASTTTSGRSWTSWSRPRSCACARWTGRSGGSARPRDGCAGACSSRSPPARAAGAAPGCAPEPRQSVLVDLDVDVHAGHERHAARVRDRDLDRDHLRDLLEVARRVGLREQ